MKIICDSKKEYDSLMKTFRYMHDFMVKDKNGKYQCLDQDYEMVGSLVHMYLEPPDFPNKSKFITIRRKKKK